ncbi:MAG: response regulator transcription factor [Chloroflexota bacterium]|nr:response regulator transcription factor [Chloroflexota bacterium]
MTHPIRVLIADDHGIVREGLRAVINAEPDMQLIGEAVDGEDARQKALALTPDVIVMDLMMPRKNGLDATREIKQADPQARILVLTSFGDDEMVFAAIKAGALGYLLKESSAQELPDAIRCLYRGESSLHPSVARKLVTHCAEEPSGAPDALTETEIAVLKLLAHGYKNQAIANQLNISERTVRFHVSNIMSKLHLENRTEVALYAIRRGLVSLEE